MFFLGKTFEKVFPNPFKTFIAFFLAYPLRESLSYRFLFLCSALGKSLNAVQTLLDFLLSHAYGRIAPASVLGPTTTKRSTKLVLRGDFSHFAVRIFHFFVSSWAKGVACSRTFAGWAQANEQKRECFARSGIYERLPIALDRKSNIYIWKAIKTPNEIPSSLRSSVLLHSAGLHFAKLRPASLRAFSVMTRCFFLYALIFWLCYPIVQIFTAKSNAFWNPSPLGEGGLRSKTDEG